MDAFVKPHFRRSILAIAQAYGPVSFWLENLRSNANSDAIWRALLVAGSLGDLHFAPKARALLGHDDSRVRAWACFALGQMKDELGLEKIVELLDDESNRVRIHAWNAIMAIVGPEEKKREVKIQVPANESLILLSDDSANMRKRLTRFYENLGFEVEEATTEEETIEMAIDLAPQAIMTDNQKGQDRLSGLNMTWDICRMPELRETLIFMLSADICEPAFLWNGGDYFFSKLRTQFEELSGVVTEYLQH